MLHTFIGDDPEFAALAKQHHTLPIAIVLNVDEAVCAQRNATRPDRAIATAAPGTPWRRSASGTTSSSAPGATCA